MKTNSIVKLLKNHFFASLLWRIRGAVTFLLLFILSAAIPDDACLNSVKKVFDEMNTASAANNVSYLKYTVVATLNEKDKNGKSIISSSTFELISTKEKSRIYSKEMIVFKDEKNTFSILPENKMIYWSDTFVKENSQDAYLKLRAMQDTVFKHAANVDCKPVNGEVYNKIITIVLDKKIGNYMGMKKVSYSINDINNSLHKVEVDYLPNNLYQHVIYVFNEQDNDYKKIDINIPVTSLVFESGTVLQKQYAGFKIIDTRKK